MKKRTALAAGLSMLTIGVAGLTAIPAQAQTTKLTYWLWDSGQLPMYEQCAANFTKANPSITVEVQQKGWDDYWTGITTGFVSGTAPDVFTDHLAKYPEFAGNDQIVDLAPLIAKDKVDTKQYLPGLYDVWGKNGKQYGLPKDWDTIGVVYNKNMVTKAKITDAELASMTWDAKTGGSFEKVLKKLTVDDKGKNASQAGFNKKKTKVYGLATPSGGAYGQTEWSHFAASNGFKFNSGPWATSYNYDDPKLAETLQWLADLSIKKGLEPAFKDIKATGHDTLFKAQKVAMITEGSWNIGTFSKLDFPVGFASLPKGPQGRKSMFNGLGDSIWKGSKNQDAAWQLLKYLASPACEVDVVGKAGVVFPAIKAGVDNVLAVYKGKNIDVSAFTNLTAEGAGSTFLFPITDNASKIGDIMSAAQDNIRFGKSTAAAELKKANELVNATFK
jgi:multiple sugar transport system substrate-binding protein